MGRRIRANDKCNVIMRLICCMLVMTMVLTGCTTIDEFNTNDVSANSSSQQELTKQEDKEDNTDNEQEQIFPGKAYLIDENGMMSFGSDFPTYGDTIDMHLQEDMLTIELIASGLDTFSIKSVIYSIKDKCIVGTIDLPQGQWLTGVR